MKLLASLLAAVVVLAAVYCYARVNRFEISHGGSSRYYVVVKLDRWTGETWKLESGNRWAPITPSE